jgi:Tol biopolymer transport system component
MNFVAISSDGATVGSNGNVSGGKSGELSLWTFPAGQYVRSFAAAPLAISADFRYLATETGVLDLQTGKSIFQITQHSDTVATAAFSLNGEYVAVVGGRSIGKGLRGQITVRRTANGSVVSSFCTRYTGALAFHPDGRTLAAPTTANSRFGKLPLGSSYIL